MAASSSSAQQDHNHRTGATGHPRDAAKHRQPHLKHLQVQVPAVAASNIGCFAGCFRPSPTSSSSAGHCHGHGDRPASPSLIRSPSAWIRAKGQSFGSGKHTCRRSRDLQYDAVSYARNFDDSGTDGEGEEDAGLAASDALKHKCFSSRLPASPPAAASSPSGLGPGTAGNGKYTEPAARGMGRDLDETISDASSAHFSFLPGP